MISIRSVGGARGPGFRLVAFASLVLALCACTANAGPAPMRWDATLAGELLGLEQTNGKLPEGARALLARALDDGHAAWGRDRPPPRTPAEFRDFGLKVSTALARHNFIQPVERADWVNSLGEAFRPIAAADPRVTAYLAHPQNRGRRPHVDPSKPFYFVDCDMAGMLILSVAQMAGFKVSVVHVPGHEFVRWEGDGAGAANWDWTHWGSYDEDYYRQRYSVSRAQENRGIFLTSQPLGAAKGYFIAALSRNVDDLARRLALRRQAATLSANDPVTASNVAWSFATTREGVTAAERADALPYALTGWAGAPDSPVHMNAVACALAARREFGLATTLQKRAIEGASRENMGRYRAELARLERRELC